jgi:hypothetical protein
VWSGAISSSRHCRGNLDYDVACSECILSCIAVSLPWTLPRLVTFFEKKAWPAIARHDLSDSLPRYRSLFSRISAQPVPTFADILLKKYIASLTDKGLLRGNQ